MRIRENTNGMTIKNNGWPQLFSGLLILIVGLSFSSMITLGHIEKAPWWFIIIGILFGVLGGWIAYTAKNRVIMLTREGQSYVHDKKLIGGKLQTHEFMASDIAAVYLHTSREHRGASGSSNKQETLSKLSLVFKTNEVIEVGQKSRNSGASISGINVGAIIRKVPLRKEAKKIASYIGVPLQTNAPGSVADTVNGIAGAISGQHAPQQSTHAPQQSRDEQVINPAANQRKDNQQS